MDSNGGLSVNTSSVKAALGRLLKGYTIVAAGYICSSPQPLGPLSSLKEALIFLFGSQGFEALLKESFQKAGILKIQRCTLENALKLW